MCRNMIMHYWKEGGTLDKCIAANGGVVSAHCADVLVYRVLYTPVCY